MGHPGNGIQRREAQCTALIGKLNAEHAEGTLLNTLKDMTPVEKYGH